MIQIIKNKELDLLLKPDIFLGKQILVAEDDETNYFLLREYLEFTGVELHWAKNGNEAVSMVTVNNEIGLILMDIQMPELNGFQALKLIKNFRNDLPIIALTAYAVSGDKEKGLKAGFSAYLSKPISRKMLLDYIIKFI